MSGEAIPIEVVGERCKWEFYPVKGLKKYFVYISQIGEDEALICIPMDDFLKVCRAFVADAENYK